MHMCVYVCMYKKRAARPIECESKPQYKKNMIRTWPSKASFSSCGLLMIKIMLKASTFSFHAGTAGHRLQGPYCFPSRLTGISTTISHEMTLQSRCKRRICRYTCRARLWFTRDGVLPRFVLELREFLNKMFPEQWAGQDGVTTPWPAPSSDLNPSDSSRWGHRNSTVYATKVNDVQAVRQRIKNGIFQRVRQSLFTRPPARQTEERIFDNKNVLMHKDLISNIYCKSVHLVCWKLNETNSFPDFVVQMGRF
jgi:hypothetical protein